MFLFFNICPLQVHVIDGFWMGPQEPMVLNFLEFYESLAKYTFSNMEKWHKVHRKILMAESCFQN